MQVIIYIVDCSMYTHLYKLNVGLSIVLYNRPTYRWHGSLKFYVVTLANMQNTSVSVHPDPCRLACFDLFKEKFNII